MHGPMPVWRAQLFCSALAWAGMRQKQTIRDDLPLIPSLDDFYEAPQTFNRTIFTVVNDDVMVDKLLDVTQKLVGDLKNPDTGVMIVTPVARAYGLES
ncbi:MAG: hypothetical protein IPG80_21300 [Anaerolineales bacterium]|uniref:hypothetical protein n=1 Tax=Candidatus Villigracilis vicinus TaxID=3140679 RepID=UPI0031366400|nr:hypothetical protein [Anaerolineales bacterium]